MSVLQRAESTFPPQLARAGLLAAAVACARVADCVIFSAAGSQGAICRHHALRGGIPIRLICLT
jgi:hypothetical protein